MKIHIPWARLRKRYPNGWQSLRRLNAHTPSTSAPANRDSRMSTRAQSAQERAAEKERAAEEMKQQTTTDEAAAAAATADAQRSVR